jgi:hypothetical protein
LKLRPLIIALILAISSSACVTSRPRRNWDSEGRIDTTIILTPGKEGHRESPHSRDSGNHQNGGTNVLIPAPLAPPLVPPLPRP